MVGDRELEEVSGNSFVPEDGAGILDGGAEVEVPALRVVGGDEIEARGVLVVEARRVHEAARARRLERLRQLPDLEGAQVRRDGDEVVRREEVGDLAQPSLVR